MMILYRERDFYKAYDEGARTLVKVLGLAGLTLYVRTGGTVEVSFPCEKWSEYRQRLLQAGYHAGYC